MVIHKDKIIYLKIKQFTRYVWYI